MSRYIAYYSADNEYETFDTFKDAEEWLIDYDHQDGISEETVDGQNFIAEVTHVSSVKKFETKKEYEDRGKDWPYFHEFEWIGEVKYLPVDKEVEIE